MDVRCPNCATLNPERAKFCLECGTALAGAPETGSRESRRVVTVVFADMVGFTSLGERLDQESLRRVMDRFYAEMRGAIESQGGTLAKFIGDAVLAVWGTPEVREDDALRAVRAAEAMRGALAGLNSDLESRWGVHVGMRTGVNTGEVVVDPSRPADLLVGDTLNVAARLEQAAADGEVLVGADTFHLVRDEAILEPVEPLALKGKSRPMPAWRLVDGLRGDRRAAPRLQAPLVGREAELDRLRASLADVIEGRSARMVTVIGSPGLGKTRLVAEFVRSLEGEATVLEGRCEASGEGITFQPVAEVLRAAASIGDEDSPDVAREKLGTVLAEDEPQRDRIVDRTATLLGLAPLASTEETFWAMRRLLESLARRRPVVLVHDDIHWGQPTFLDLLEHLVAWVRDAPLLIVALARPELREVRPGLAEPGAVVSDVLALEPLAPDASRTLATRLLGDANLPEGLAERVLETTEGNPLFLGEMLRMLADEGVLRREGERWVAARDTAGIAVPPTIQALLAARIERLAGDERSVVERAAVIGHQFYRGAVAELAPPAVRPKIDMALDTLRRKDLVRPEDFLWLDEKVFRFHHVLIRDAAYRSLLKEARAELHERFADWLEAKAGDVAGEHEEVIAFHLEQAYSYRLELGALDDHGRALAERAAVRLRSAGRRALAREDLPAAINLLRRALAPIAADDPRLSDVRVDLAEALLSAGDTAEAEPVIEEIGLAADAHGDERLGAWATVFLGQLDNLTGAGHVRESLEAVTEAAEILARVGDRAGEAKAHQVIAAAEGQLGQVAAAEAALDRALVAARAADDRRRITAVLSGAPRAALWGPAPIVRASGRCLDVVRILRMTPGNRHVEAAALRCQAVLEAMRGRSDAARGILDNCRMTFEELGLTLELQETDVHAGIVELLAGDAAAAEEPLRAAQDGFTALGAHGGAAQAAALLARALLEQGREDEAFDATRVAEDHGGEDLKTTIAWLGVRAEALARRGDEHEALILARRGAELAEPTDALADKADALMALAAVELAARDVQAARAAARRARELYAAKDHAVGVARAEALAGSTPVAAPAAADPAEAEWTPRTPAELVHARWNEAFNTRDWDAMAQLLAPEHRIVSRRTLTEDATEGPEASLAMIKSVAAIGDITVRFRSLAASYEVVAGVQIWHGIGETGGPGEVEQGLVSVNLDGRVVYGETFEADDELGMLRRFEELRGEHTTSAAALVTCRAATAFNAGDGEALTDTFAEDYVQLDHTNVGLWTLGRSQNVAALMSWREIAPDAIWAWTRTFAADEDRFAGVATGIATDPDGGGTITLVFGQVVQVSDGRATHADIYDPEDEAAILARFEELRAPAQSALLLGWRDAHARRDWDALAEFYAEGYSCNDHRGLGWDIDTRDDVVAQQRAVMGIDPDYRVDVTIQREAPGAEVALISFHGREREWDVTFVAVRRIAGEQIVSDDLFDAEDEEAIAACFEALVAESPATASGARSIHPEARAYAERMARAFNERDWDSYPDLITGDLHVRDLRLATVVDHRGIDEFLLLLGAVVRAVEGAELQTETIAAELLPGGELIQADRQVYGREGRAVRAGVVGVRRNGRMFRADILGDDPDALLAHYDATKAELLGGAAELPPQIRAALDDWTEVLDAGDWDRLARFYAPDVVHLDHRPGIRDDHHGRAELVELFRSLMAAGDATVRWEPIASRSARLFSARMIVSGTGEHGVEYGHVFDHVIAVDNAGLITRVEVFQPEQRDQLLRRLDELARENSGQAAGFDPRTAATMDAWADALRAGDWERLERFWAPDVVALDRRAGVRDDRIGREAVLGGWRSVRELGGSVEVDWEPLEQRADWLYAFRRHFAGSGEHGERWESAIDQIAVQGLDGRGVHYEIFEANDPALQPRLDELEREGPPPPLIERTSARWGEAFEARDFEAIAALYGADAVFVDRRPLGGPGTTGEGGFKELIASVAEMGTETRHDGDVLIARGEHHALLRNRYHGDAEQGGAWEVVVFMVLEVDEEGRIARSEIFDVEQEAEARARLDELAGPLALTLGPLAVPGPATQTGALWVAALNAHDLDAIEALLPEGYRYEDRRPGIAHAGDRVATVESWRSSFEALPDLQVDAVALAAQGRHCITAERWTAADRSHEIGILTVAEIDAGGLRAAWVHEPGDPAAWDLYVELIAGPLRLVSTDAGTWQIVELDDDGSAGQSYTFDDEATAREWWPHVEHVRRMRDALASADAVALRQLMAEDFRQLDMRSVGAEPVDADGFVAMIQQGHEVFTGAAVDYEILAVRGDHRAVTITLHGSAPDGGGPAELQIHNLTRMSGGRMVYGEVFDTPEDAVAACEAASAGDEPLVQDQVMTVRDGLVRSTDVYEVDDPAAVQKYESRALAVVPDEDGAVRLADGVEPTALTELYAEWTDAINRHDVDALAPIFAEDFRHADHRPGMRHVMHGRDEVVGAYRDSFSQSADLRITSVVLAATNEVLHARVTFYGTGGRFEIVQEQVSAVRDGLSRTTDVYEVGDPAARARFEELLDDATTAVKAPVVDRFDNAIAAFNVRDWETFGGFYGDDFAFDDHRPAFLASTRGGTEFIAWMREMATGELRWTHEPLDLRGHAMLTRVMFSGSYKGGPFENVMYDVVAIRGDGLFRSAEIYDENQLTEARARLDELAALRAPATGG